MEMKLDYGNWIRRRTLVILGLLALVTGVLFLVPGGVVYRLVLGVAFFVCLFSFLIPLYAYLYFSQRGGGFQDRLYECILHRLGVGRSGTYLDIGSGNGVLAVKLALVNPAAEVVGIDSWGADWEYSQARAERNARIANVDDRVRFQRGDAASLPFASETFDGAVSNLTFHEVRGTPDKRAVLREALRVIAPGGAFTFVDYFLEKKYYGPLPSFEESLAELGLSEVDLKALSEVLTIPQLLKHPRILGRVGILSGKK